MSIIYDALKKVENSKKPDSKLGSLHPDKVKMGKSIAKRNFVFYFIFIFMVVIGFIISRVVFNLFFHRMPPLAETKTQNNLLQPPVISVSPKDNLPPEEPQAVIQEAASDFILNGIFSDGENSYAIINNRVVREGDTITGAKVLNILAEQVVLEVQGKTLNIKIKN
jgi:hypothetical protein